MTDCLRKNRPAVLFSLLTAALNFFVFWLYRLNWEPFFYVLALCLFFLLIFLSVDFFYALSRARERENAMASILTQWNSLPEPVSLTEADHREMILALGQKAEALQAELSSEKNEIEDTFTAWVHQIKTPIAVIKLQTDPDTEEGRGLLTELFRIEQYVEMALHYIRLSSGTNDLVISEVDLDALLREEIRKFAPQFISRKLKLDYTPTDLHPVTDRKWLACILDQLLSNAVKYTSAGTVSVCVRDRILTVSDTGIGIYSEDLPRIFEKGYTGINGRLGQKSSGLGLYLCKKAADKLAMPLWVESSPGKGASFSLDLSQP